MAFTATLEFDVRTTGNDANGGGFDPTSGTPGTDYSQQDSPQVTYTDLVIDGTTNTKCTSAGTPFTSAHVGNIINVTSGTGFTVQRVQVLSVAGSTATCDKSLGTLSSTGGNGKLGGSLATIASAAALVTVDYQTVHVKAGTYTFTSNVALPAHHQQWYGYSSTHFDNGTKPLITTATSSCVLLSIPGVSCRVKNFAFTTTASSGRTNAINGSSAYSFLTIEACTFDGFSDTINMGGNSAYMSLIGCTIKNGTGTGAGSAYRAYVFGCWFHNLLDYGYQNSGYTTISHCVFSSCGSGITVSGYGLGVANCVFYSNGTAASITTPELSFVNCVFYGNTTHGLYGAFAGPMVNCAWGSNGDKYPTAAWPKNNGEITLTANPFTNAAAGDFSLNSTAGGGVLLKQAGYPGTIAGYGQSYLDVGAVQASGGSSVTFPAASKVYAGTDRGDGVTGTLHASNIATAAGSGSNLSAGNLASGVTVDDVTGTLVGGGLLVHPGMSGGIRG